MFDKSIWLWKKLHEMENENDGLEKKFYKKYFSPSLLLFHT